MELLNIILVQLLWWDDSHYFLDKYPPQLKDCISVGILISSSPSCNNCCLVLRVPAVYRQANCAPEHHLIATKTLALCKIVIVHCREEGFRLEAVYCHSFFQSGSVLEITLQTARVYWQYINSIHSRSIKKNDKYKVWIYSLRFCTKILKPFVKLTKESEKLKSFIAAVMNLEVSDEEPLLQERVWHLLCLFCLLKISPLCFNVYVDSLGHCKK